MKHNWIKLRLAFALNAKDPRCLHQLIWSTGGPVRNLFRYFEKKCAHLRECTIHKVVSETKSVAGCSHVCTNPTCIVISDQREADVASIEGREAPVPKIVAKSLMPPLPPPPQSMMNTSESYSLISLQNIFRIICFSPFEKKNGGVFSDSSIFFFENIFREIWKRVARGLCLIKLILKLSKEKRK